MSDLSEFLRNELVSQTAFAEVLGISRSYLSEILSGEKRPGLDLAFRIERATGGEVTASSFVKPEDAA